jgi:prophage maintenance system killer protein
MAVACADGRVVRAPQVGHFASLGERVRDRRAATEVNCCRERNRSIGGGHSVTRQIEYFNLDAILSVGYRVNSKRGTQFRIWATHTLREHLLRGYTLNERRLREKGLGEMEQAVSLLARTLDRHELVTDEGAPCSTWSSGTRARGGSSSSTPGPSGAGLFGQERGDQLDAILGSVEQTFGGEPLYTSVQVRAAHLLYFLIKDHPFSDGNKRIGTLLFLEYLRRNGMLVSADGRFLFTDNTLVALALLVAESDAKQKDLMIRLILSLLEGGG